MNAETGVSVGVNIAPAVGVATAVETFSGFSSFGPNLVGDLGSAPLTDFHAPDLNTTTTAFDGFARMNGDIASDTAPETIIMQEVTDGHIPQVIVENTATQNIAAEVIEQEIKDALVDMPNLDDESRARVLALAEDAGLTELPAVQEVQQQENQAQAEKLNQDENNDKNQTKAEEKNEDTKEDEIDTEENSEKEELEKQEREDEEKRKKEEMKKRQQEEQAKPVVDQGVNKWREQVLVNAASGKENITGDDLASIFEKVAPAKPSGLVHVLGLKRDGTVELVAASLRGRRYSSASDVGLAAKRATTQYTAVTVSTYGSPVGQKEVQNVVKG